eukprot:502229_1
MQQVNEQLRRNWKVGSLCEVYSDSRKQWFEGQIIDIYSDQEGEWLKINYAKVSTKEVQRFSDSIRPIMLSNQIITPQEQQAIDNIKMKKDIITNKINASSKDIITLTNYAKTNENNMNEFRKQAIDRLNKRMDEIIKQSHIKIQQKEENTSEYIRQLKLYQKSLIQIDSKVNDLLKNNELNKTTRQRHIIDMTERVLKSEKKDIDITIIKADIDKDYVLKFIDNIGEINTYLYPLTPIIYVLDIDATSATIHFYNIRSDYECITEMKMNSSDSYDEKEMNEAWQQICCIKHAKKCTINDMESDTVYCIRVKYKNRTGFGNYSNIIQLTTKKTDVQIHSSILRIEEIKSFIKLLSENKKYLGNKWELIYSSNKDKLNKDVFIDKVYDKSNIVVFIETYNGNICGGYSKIGWNKNGKNGTYTQDDDAFIFGIRSCKNYPICLRSVNMNNSDYVEALRYHPAAYCMFGKNGVLYIYKNGNVFHNDPVTYNTFQRNRQLLAGESNEKKKDRKS